MSDAPQPKTKRARVFASLCPWGCDEPCTMANYDEHKRTCNLRKRLCWVGDCEWEGQPSDTSSHCERDHWDITHDVPDSGVFTLELDDFILGDRFLVLQHRGAVYVVCMIDVDREHRLTDILIMANHDAPVPFRLTLRDGTASYSLETCTAPDYCGSRVSSLVVPCKCTAPRTLEVALPSL